jgi:signal transduction histidine kinase
VDNIITNALRYGACCRVRVCASERYATLTMEDDGPGIPEDAFEHVFRPFKRLDPSRNVKTGGVGLGLAIARDIVQAHGGDIILKNRVDDHGRRIGLLVTVRVPLKKA